MKSKLNSFLFLYMLLFGTAFGQTSADIIYLNDGSFIKGSIMEYKANQHVRIQTLDGKVIQYPATDLKKIKNKGFGSVKFFTPKVSGYYNISTLGLLMRRGSYGDILSSPSFETINGYQFNSKYLVGGGTGIEIMDARVFAPVFADFKYMFRSGKFSPYVGAKVGYAIAFQENRQNIGFWGGYETAKRHGGVLAGAEAGIRGYLGNHLGMIFGIEYRFQQDRSSITDSFWDDGDYIAFPVEEVVNMHKVGLKLGIIFH